MENYPQIIPLPLLIWITGTVTQTPWISRAALNPMSSHAPGGWSGGAMVLGKLPVPGRPTVWTTVGQGPTALAVGADGGCLDILSLVYPLFSFSLFLGDGSI